MLALQRELSQAIAEQIRLTLAPERLQALGRRQTQNAAAYDLYLHGRHFWHQLSPPTTKTLLSISQERYVPPYAMAIVHAGLSQFDLALQWLERCYEARDVHVIFLTIDPKWDPLRADIRFSTLLQRCGFARNQPPQPG